MSFALAALLLVGTASVEAGTPKPEAPKGMIRGPIKMKASQIKAYNAELPKDHPAYIRCESQKVTGSIAMRNKVCRTNQEWARIEGEGNRAARTLVDSMNKGWSNGTLPGG